MPKWCGGVLGVSVKYLWAFMSVSRCLAVSVGISEMLDFSPDYFKTNSNIKTDVLHCKLAKND